MPEAHRHHAIDYIELTVTDLEQTLAAVTEAGGAVVSGPYEFPGGDLVLHCATGYAAPRYLPPVR